MKSINRITAALCCATALLAACDGNTEPTPLEQAPLELSVYQQPMTDITTRATRTTPHCADGFSPSVPVTRATGYVAYDAIFGANGLFTHQTSNVNASVLAFFATAGEQEERLFNYRSIDSKWITSATLTAGTYEVCGFLPAEEVEDATLSGLPTEDGGATLTLRGLSVVTASDVCVIVGASDDASNLTTGLFTYAHSTSRLYLLFDHIYAGLRFNFKVEEQYNQLRTIKLKQLSLKPYNGTTAIREKVNATVTLKATADGTSPIVGDVAFTPDETSAATSIIIYNVRAGEEPVTLTTTASAFLGCFAPAQCNSFVLASTYNVYDKRGNLIREDCVAENTINISDVLYQDLVRGHMYTINLTVRPSYLYMLSEPDLDNPTVN